MCITQNIILSPSFLIESYFFFQALSKGDAQTTEQQEEQEKLGGGYLSQFLLPKNWKTPWCSEMRTSGENLAGRAQGRASGL